MSASPYRGLMPFSERQAPFFFGRAGEREIVSANLLASRLTVLYGPSGVGKSSLLNAGVACDLRRMALGRAGERGSPEFTVIVFRSWRDDPLCALSRVISRQLREETPGSFDQKLEVLSSRFECDLLIILDQFEEYFLYHPDEDGRAGFAAEFARAVNRSALRASFLISIREDSLAKLDRFEASIPGIFENRLRIDHLDLDAAREAIRGPIEKFNRLRFNRGRPVKIEDRLVEGVLEQVRATRVLSRDADHLTAALEVNPAPADGRVETPYLQLVMTRLWEEERREGSRALRAETLDRLGGAKKIVSSHLDDALSSLTPEETEAAAMVFNHLVTPSRTKIAHSVPDLANYANVSSDALSPLLQKLSTGQNRILTPVAPAPDQPAHLRYQILHDILAASVLEWRTRYVQGRGRAEAEARAEEQRRRAEQEASAGRRLRKLSMLLLAMVFVASGFAWVAASQKSNAEVRRLEAEAARLDAEAAKHTAQAGRLELEAAIREKNAAESLAELNRLQAEAAQAELTGMRERASRLRRQAAETRREVDAEQEASATLGREAAAERKSAATSHQAVDRLRRQDDRLTDDAGVRGALERYRAAYRNIDVAAIMAVYPQLPNDRKKHLKRIRAMCQTYEVTLSVLRTHQSAPDTVMVEAQSDYRCVPKAGGQMAVLHPMREDLWLRKDTQGAWIIDRITAPSPGR